MRYRSTLLSMRSGPSLGLGLRLLEEVLPAGEERLERIPRLLVRRQRLDVRPVRGEPTLEVGDFILVNKFVYGIRLPIIEKKIIPLGDPKRGDVVVFRYPINPTQDFIKRVIGVGGDVVEYRDKRLTVNGEPWPQRADGSYSYLEGLRFDTLERAFERTDAAAGAQEHTIGINTQAPPVYPPNVRNFPGRDNCDYNERGFTCRVPAGQYLMMGDNRDNSDDSRYWGFVPDDHIRGKAFFIWFNWDDIASLAFKRVGSGIH